MSWKRLLHFLCFCSCSDDDEALLSPPSSASTAALRVVGVVWHRQGGPQREAEERVSRSAFNTKLTNKRLPASFPRLTAPWQATFFYCNKNDSSHKHESVIFELLSPSGLRGCFSFFLNVFSRFDSHFPKPLKKWRFYLNPGLKKQNDSFLLLDACL